jgi:hypothetical protein
MAIHIFTLVMKAYLSFLIFITCYSLFGQQAVLTKMPIYAWKSSDPLYNPYANKLVYYAMDTWVDGQRYGNAIVIRDMETEKEAILETKTIYPALGWIDPSNLLIYQTYPLPDTTLKRKFFSRDYGRLLYKLNIEDRTRNYIRSIPLPETDNCIKVSGDLIVYQSGFNNKSKLFKLNIRDSLAQE